MQSITELSKLNGRVYVYLPSDEVGIAFMNQAEKEGFTFCDGVKPTQRAYNRIMAVNSNHTINYVGWAGHAAYGASVGVLGGLPFVRIRTRIQNDGALIFSKV